MPVGSLQKLQITVAETDTPVISTIFQVLCRAPALLHCEQRRADVHMDTIQRMPFIFSTNAKGSLTEQNEVRVVTSHFLHIVQSENALHLLRKMQKQSLNGARAEQLTSCA